VLLIMCVTSAKIANELINKNVYYEFDTKTIQFYDLDYKVY